MIETMRFVKIEMLKSLSVENICDLLDKQEQQLTQQKVLLDDHKKALDVAMECIDSIESNTDTTITSRVYVKRAKKEINQILGKEGRSNGKS